MATEATKTDVQIGDVWKDLEAELRFNGRDRRVRVTGFSDKNARGAPVESVLAVDITNDDRKTTIQRMRMRPGKLGWRLVERGGKPIPAEPQAGDS